MQQVRWDHFCWEQVLNIYTENVAVFFILAGTCRLIDLCYPAWAEELPGQWESQHMPLYTDVPPDEEERGCHYSAGARKQSMGDRVPVSTTATHGLLVQHIYCIDGIHGRYLKLYGLLMEKNLLRVTEQLPRTAALQ